MVATVFVHVVVVAVDLVMFVVVVAPCLLVSFVLVKAGEMQR